MFSRLNSTQPFEFTIPDNLLTDDFIKYKGYPLKGRGYASGVYYSDGKTYIDFLMTDKYFAHIKVQCDENGLFVPGGDIIFPTGWNTDEKKEQVLLKSYKLHTNKNQ